jgi:sugar O-acyltransferase (sialic acid O-acetyltransferase NeuD family)
VTKTKKLILFGEGLYTEIALQYFTDDSEYEVVSFTKDDDYITGDTYLGLPMVPFSKVQELYPPAEFDMHIAVSYTNLNHLRERVFHEAKEKGYTLPSYISSKSSIMTKYPIGENCFIFEDNTVQPFVKIEDNVILWSGNHIGHHSTIKSHNFLSSHVVVSGQCTVESYCFVGVNSTIAHMVTIAEETLVGAGASITKNTEKGAVYVPARSVKLDKPSSSFNL